MADATLTREWLLRLSARCVPTREEESLAVRMAAYVEGFADMPNGAFSKPSLEAMSRLFDLFPPYAKLRRGLEQWLKRNPLPSTFVALPGTEDATAALETSGLSAEDRCAVRLWIEHRAKRDLSAQELATRLAIIRRHNAAGFRWLIRSPAPAGAASLEAASIAVQRGWEVGEPEGPGAWVKDADAIRASLAKIPQTGGRTDTVWLAVLRAACEKYAPDNLHLIPASMAEVSRAEKDFSEAALANQKSTVPPQDLGGDPAEATPAPDALAKFAAKHGRPAGQLTPEVLQAAREANPVSRTLLRTPAERAQTAANDAYPHREAEPTQEPAEPPSEAVYEGADNSRPRMPWDVPA